MNDCRFLYLDGRRGTKGILANVFEKIIKEGLCERVFYDGGIQTPAQFIDAMFQPGWLPFIALSPKSELLAFIWLNNIECRCARLHFTGFRAAAKCSPPDIGRHFLNYVLTIKDKGGYLFDVITGVTPKSNRLACRFIIRAGMQLIGELPYGAHMHYEGRTDDALLTFVTRESLGIAKDSEGSI